MPKPTKKSKPKPTAGERIMVSEIGRDVEVLRTSPLYPAERRLARKIDAAIRRAVREAAQARRDYEHRCSLVDNGAEPREYEDVPLDKYEAKWGVRP